MAYQHSRKVTIRNFVVTGGPHTNFPVLFWGFPDTPDFNVQHRYPWLKSVANGGKVYSETGIDIIFSLDPYGSRILPFERVAYDPVTGLVEFYIRLPLVTHDDVPCVYYVLYGDPDAPDRSNRTGVWDDTFVGVYHFGDGVTLDVTDSTQYGNHGTNVGAIAAPGMVGTTVAGLPTGGSLGCWGLGYVLVPDSPSLQSLTDGMTFEFSIFNNPPGDPLEIINGAILSKILNLIEDPADLGSGFKITVSGVTIGDTQHKMHFIGNGEIPSVPPFAPFFGTGESNFIGVGVAATYDEAIAHLYIDGNIDVVDSPQAWGPTAITHTSAPLQIGSSTNGFGGIDHIWPGWIDEVRLSNQPRSSDWTRTTSNSIGDPAHLFFFVGPEVQLGNTQPQVFVIT